MAAVEQATGIYENLVSISPDVFVPEYAASPLGKSKRLADLGRTQEALSAVEQATYIYRPLARDRHDAFRPPFVEALHTQANLLSMLGRDAEASDLRNEAAAEDGR